MLNRGLLSFLHYFMSIENNKYRLNQVNFNGVLSMKMVKILVLIISICSMSFFSWTYHAGKSLDRKLERATLVMEYIAEVSCP